MPRAATAEQQQNGGSGGGKWLTGSFSPSATALKAKASTAAEMPVSHCKWSAVFIGQVSDSYATESIISSSVALSLVQYVITAAATTASRGQISATYKECWWHGLRGWPGGRAPDQTDLRELLRRGAERARDWPSQRGELNNKKP